ncbi:hypothetical protein McpCs1_06960 [Methanocorpusculaceae archaeon Cs1]|uniref:Uncharacterized protein n=1 Tax=Methanorbis rubei TaxID=3028300 RepID=A0AAE4MFQ7_9EURY|nr:hypothetical protein [Methanocorpusculaceae archaeon Cs1]
MNSTELSFKIIFMYFHKIIFSFSVEKKPTKLYFRAVHVCSVMFFRETPRVPFFRGRLINQRWRKKNQTWLAKL